MNITEATLFWGFLLDYGVIMYVLSPKSRNPESFYKGTDDHGNSVGQWSLTASIFISWIFAKSVTNAANLGAAYGHRFLPTLFRPLCSCFFSARCCL